VVERALIWFVGVKVALHDYGLCQLRAKYQHFIKPFGLLFVEVRNCKSLRNVVRKTLTLPNVCCPTWMNRLVMLYEV
jgi:hypothetical protein